MRLSPENAYVLWNRAGSAELTAIGLGEGPASPALVLPAIDWNGPPLERLDATATGDPVVVPIKILVDEDERAGSRRLGKATSRPDCRRVGNPGARLRGQTASGRLRNLGVGR